MVWWCVTFCLLSFGQVLVKKVHPLRLACVTIVFGLVSGASLCFFVGPIFAVAHFLVLMGGVLVVFAYSVALVPLRLKKKKGGSSHLLKENHWNKSYKVFLLLIIWLSSVVELHPGPFVFLFFTECCYVSVSWAKMIVALSVYLLLTMIVAVSICSVEKGALIR